MGPTATSAPHRGAIDAARVGALVLVVLGHLSLAVIDRGPDGALRGDNVLALHPGLAWVAMLAPMPVFFAAAGWANATSTPAGSARRLRSLVGVGAVVVAVWSTASMVELLVRGEGEGDIVADGARIATQPLWFLAAYVPFAACGAWLAGIARRPVIAIGVCLGVLAALDIARFAFDAPEGVGWPGFFLAWVVPWLAGAAWRRRHEAGQFDEVRVGLGLAGVATVAAVGLVLAAGYFPSLIDAVEGERSNTTPPTLFTSVAALVQVGLLMVAGRGLDRLARRWRGLLDRAGEAAVGVYVWHLSGLALCAAALAAGLWAPQRFSLGWWLTRPLWFAVVLGVTGLLVGLTSKARRTKPPAERSGSARVWVGLVLTTVGAAIVGLWGPRTVTGAIASVVAFDGGWWFLRSTPPRPHLHPHPKLALRRAPRPAERRLRGRGGGGEGQLEGDDLLAGPAFADQPDQDRVATVVVDLDQPELAAAGEGPLAVGPALHQARPVEGRGVQHRESTGLAIGGVVAVGAVVDGHHVGVAADHHQVADAGVGDGVGDLLPLGHRRSPPQLSAPDRPRHRSRGSGLAHTTRAWVGLRRYVSSSISQRLLGSAPSIGVGGALGAGVGHDEPRPGRW